MHRRALLQLGLVSTAAPTLALAASRAVDANAHGAVGDGKTLNTRAIQAAIDEAARTGGTVAFKPGVYLTGSLFLKSGVTLRLDKGVTILGSQEPGRLSGDADPRGRDRADLAGGPDQCLQAEERPHRRRRDHRRRRQGLLGQLLGPAPPL
jgi:polygalacturonase